MEALRNLVRAILTADNGIVLWNDIVHICFEKNVDSRIRFYTDLAFVFNYTNARSIPKISVETIQKYFRLIKLTDTILIESGVSLDANRISFEDLETLITAFADASIGAVFRDICDINTMYETYRTELLDHDLYPTHIAALTYIGSVSQRFLVKLVAGSEKQITKRASKIIYNQILVRECVSSTATIDLSIIKYHLLAQGFNVLYAKSLIIMGVCTTPTLIAEIDNARDHISAGISIKNVDIPRLLRSPSPSRSLRVNNFTDLRLFESSNGRFVDIDQHLWFGTPVADEHEDPEEEAIPLDVLYHMNNDIPSESITSLNDLHIVDADHAPHHVTDGMLSMISLIDDTEETFIDDIDEGYES